MSDAFEPRLPEVGEETRQLISLGDGQADNAKLAAALDKLADRVNNDAPSEWRVVELLKQLLDIGWLPCRFACHVLKEAVKRFTDHEIRLIKAKAEAEKLNAEAEAIRAKSAADAQATVASATATAEKTRAEAEVLSAEAKKKEAEAAQLQSLIGKREILLARLKGRGIDFQAEVGNDGKMRVVVTKSPPADPAS